MYDRIGPAFERKPAFFFSPSLLRCARPSSLRPAFFIEPGFLHRAMAHPAALCELSICGRGGAEAIEERGEVLCISAPAPDRGGIDWLAYLPEAYRAHETFLLVESKAAIV